jgi:hypothetical protein
MFCKYCQHSIDCDEHLSSGKHVLNKKKASASTAKSGMGTSRHQVPLEGTLKWLPEMSSFRTLMIWMVQVAGVNTDVFLVYSFDYGEKEVNSGHGKKGAAMIYWQLGSSVPGE